VASVIQHPRYNDAAAARLHRLRRSIADDRERATIALKVALTKLEALRRHNDAPALQTLSAEYAACLGSLARVDPAQADDSLIALLEHIQGRLRYGLDVLAGLCTQAPADGGHGESHD
jgi:hypothetical protein